MAIVRRVSSPFSPPFADKRRALSSMGKEVRKTVAVLSQKKRSAVDGCAMQKMW
jgi:hypothetical protein